MVTDDEIILLLRQYKVLTDRGLDLSVLHDGRRFGENQIIVTSFAILWELAKRYNLIYRARKDGRYVFESEEAWMLEAKWFAHEILKEWSGDRIPWLEIINPPGVKGAPNRNGSGDQRQLGQLPWLKDAAAYAIHLKVYWLLETGYLADFADLDPNIEDRETMLPTPENMELVKYRPFCKPSGRVRIAPTNVEETVGGMEYEEGWIIEPPRPEPSPGYNNRMYEERAIREDEAFKYKWQQFLSQNRQSPVEAGIEGDISSAFKVPAWELSSSPFYDALRELMDADVPVDGNGDDMQEPAYSVQFTSKAAHD